MIFCLERYRTYLLAKLSHISFVARRPAVGKLIPPVRHRAPAFRLRRAEPRSEETDGADALDAAARRPVQDSLDRPASDGRVGGVSSRRCFEIMICPSAPWLLWRTHSQRRIPPVATVQRSDEMLA